MTLLTDQAAWQQLQAYYQRFSQEMLERRPDFKLDVAGLSFDYSRNHLDEHSLALFSDLADQSELSDAILRMVNGEPVNFSEQRPALHTLLRDFANQPEEVKQVYSRMQSLSEELIAKGITDVIHVGIGGSYLGTRFLYDAFSALQSSRCRCHFIANQNTAALEKLLSELDPEKTAVVIVSKSFTTTETMSNAKPIVAWFKKCLQQAWQQHVFAVTAATSLAVDWGIDKEAVFPMWDWIGGRFSLWSAVSFCLMIAFGWSMFEALLNGAYKMDQHFQSQPWNSNAPVLLAFIGLVYRHFFAAQTQAIIPYHNSLTRLPSHLQQLHMESLGKQVSTLGNPLDYPTGAIIWGGTGPGSQHSFHQLLLQGRDIVPVDFIVMADDLAACKNCYAQATALMMGNRDEDVSSYQYLPGNRSSTIITMTRLSCENLGALLAMYEHKVFVQSVLWNINAFDQWGVEAGKKLAKQIEEKNV